jgi:hypothetical protein
MNFINFLAKLKKMQTKFSEVWLRYGSTYRIKLPFFTKFD